MNDTGKEFKDPVFLRVLIKFFSGFSLLIGIVISFLTYLFAVKKQADYGYVHSLVEENVMSLILGVSVILNLMFFFRLFVHFLRGFLFDDQSLRILALMAFGGEVASFSIAYVLLRFNFFSIYPSADFLGCSILLMIVWGLVQYVFGLILDFYKERKGIHYF